MRYQPRPLVRVGDIIVVPESDYLYGVGPLTLRITAIEVEPKLVERLEWVRLRGIPIYWNLEEGSEREALVRVTALRTQRP